MAAPLHAILQRDELSDRGLFIMPRPAPSLDPDEELEREMGGALDEIFAVTSSQSLVSTNETVAPSARGTISRRDAVQSLEDEDAALMLELVPPARSSSSASIDSDFSMSVLSQNNSDADDDDSMHPPVAAGSRQYSMSLELREADSEEDEATPPASVAAASAASQSSRQNSMVWSEIGEASRASTPILPQSPLSLDYDPNQPILDHDLGSMAPSLFVPPMLPPLETEEQIEARERVELETRHAQLVAIAEQHAAVARQQLQILHQTADRENGARPDKANRVQPQGRMSAETINEFMKRNVKGLGSFFFMQPATYTRQRQFRLHGRTPQKLVWSIKLDGNRALWDGWQQLLISKSGKVRIQPPSFWRLMMPRDCYLDGELFAPSTKRANGTQTEFAAALYDVAPVWRVNPASVSGHYSSLHDSKWMRLQFHAFDIVSEQLYDRKLEYRLGVLEATLRQFEANLLQSSGIKENPVLSRVYVGHLDGTTSAEVHESIGRLLLHYGGKLGAEGIVVKDLNSNYHHTSPGPVVGWLKVKYYEDVQAKVIDFFPASEHRTRTGQVVIKPKGVVILLPDQRRTTQSVTFANGNLIVDNLLRKNMIVTIAFMPDRDRPDSDQLRTPIIRSIVEDGTTWEDVQQREREKEQEARGSN